MEQHIEQVTAQVLQRLFIPLEASGRHIHLSREAALYLFGHELTEKRPLSQPGQFLCWERLSIETEKGRLEQVAVLGPCRRECQVELSQTDCVTLGLEAPVRLSGNTENTPGVTLINGEKRLSLPHGVIIAMRHIHMTPEDAERRKLKNGESVRLKVLTQRPLIFEQVPVRVSPAYTTYAHLDYDEANACGFRKGDLGLIL